MSNPQSSPLTRRRFLQRVGVIGAAAMTSGIGPRVRSAGAAESINLALDWYPNANHAGLFIARERGFFEREGLEINIYTPSDPTTVLQTVGAGQDDFGISYQTDVLLARAQGVPVVSIAALVQHPLLGVMTLKERNITRPRDLAGKTVGYPGIPSQEAFLATMLEQDGSGLDNVRLINVDFNLVPSVISGRVDAVMGAYRTHETILAEREGYEVSFMPVEEWGVPDYYELVLVTNEQFLRDRIEVARSLLRAISDGYAAAIADPAAAIETLADAYAGIDREVETEGIDILIPLWQDGEVAFGVQAPERWDAFGAWMKERGLIPGDLDVSKAYAADVLTPLPESTPIA